MIDALIRVRTRPSCQNSEARQCSFRESRGLQTLQATLETTLLVMHRRTSGRPRYNLMSQREEIETPRWN